MKRHANELKAKRTIEGANDIGATSQTVSTRLKYRELKVINELCERLGITRANFFRFCFMAGLEELSTLKGRAELNKYVSDSKLLIDMEQEYLNDPDPVRRLIANRFSKLLDSKNK